MPNTHRQCSILMYYSIYFLHMHCVFLNHFYMLLGFYSLTMCGSLEADHDKASM